MKNHNQQIEIKGKVEFTVIDDEGHEVSNQKVENIIVDGLKDNVVNNFNNDSSTNDCSGYEHIALGSDDTAADQSQTELQNELEASDFNATSSEYRISDFVGTNLNDNEYIVSGSITNNSGTDVVVKESGLFDDASYNSGNMGSRTVLNNSVNLKTDEQIKVKWIWTVS